MKTLFVAINAKYIHTNLAVRYMHELAKQNGYTSTEIAEYTINVCPSYCVNYILQKPII